MTNEQIERIALECGFVHKTQPEGTMALHPHVFDFARRCFALEREACAEVIAEYDDPEWGYLTQIECIEAIMARSDK